jgi:hypothetical protein
LFKAEVVRRFTTNELERGLDMDAAYNYLGVGIPGNIGVHALGRALSVPCPICGVSTGERCVEPKDGDRLAYRASHVERGRIARYAVMGIPPITAAEREA